MGYLKMVVANFLVELRGTRAVSRHKDVLKVGINITFHKVLRVASRSQFLAGLTAKLSIVPPPLGKFFSRLHPKDTWKKIKLAPKYASNKRSTIFDLCIFMKLCQK